MLRRDDGVADWTLPASGTLLNDRGLALHLWHTLKKVMGALKAPVCLQTPRELTEQCFRWCIFATQHAQTSSTE